MIGYLMVSRYVLTAICSQQVYVGILAVEASRRYATSVSSNVCFFVHTNVLF